MSRKTNLKLTPKTKFKKIITGIQIHKNPTKLTTIFKNSNYLNDKSHPIQACSKKRIKLPKKTMNYKNLNNRRKKVKIIKMTVI